MVLDEEDQKAILQRIYDENGLTLRDFPFRKCLDAIEIYKSKSNYVPFLADTERKIPAPDLPQAGDTRSMHFIILQYLENQRKNFYLDFADLIQFVLYLFDTDPANFRTFRASSTSWRGGSRGSTKTCSSWATPTRPSIPGGARMCASSSILKRSSRAQRRSFSIKITAPRPRSFR